MKKFIIPLVIVLCVLTVAALSVLNTSAENGGEESEVSIPENTVITYGYLEVFKEQLKQELIEELSASGGITLSSAYQDISATEGQLILLAPNSEVIYRGGGAAAVTSSDKKGEGITDMSLGTEIFSGEPLEYGHIYHASESDSKKAIIITGPEAYFTIRGEYELG